MRLCALCARRPVEVGKKYCSDACAHTAQLGTKKLRQAKRDAQLAAARRAVR